MIYQYHLRYWQSSVIFRTTLINFQEFFKLFILYSFFKKFIALEINKKKKRDQYLSYGIKYNRSSDKDWYKW